MTQVRFAVIVPKGEAQYTRKVLEDGKVWDSTRKLQCLGGDKVAIPVLNAELAETILLTDHCRSSEHGYGKGFEITRVDLAPSKKSLLKTPYDSLVERLTELVRRSDMAGLWEELQSTIPRHWEIHGDLALLPPTAFVSNSWKAFGKNLWPVVAESLGCKRLGRKHVISTNGFRTPQVELLLGENGWVNHTDNGIQYSYDVSRCMFSSGNVTEKLRVANFDCTGQTVVDLYAGIGYFTLPYLVHAGAERVHACEWNPDAVEALQRNLTQNGVEGRCVVHVGDNRQVCPEGVADRVNLGLIPSSEEGWPVACTALKPTGGTLHIHSNVTTKVSSTTVQDGDKTSIDKKASNDVKITRSTDCQNMPVAAENSAICHEVDKLGTQIPGCSSLSCNCPNDLQGDACAGNIPESWASSSNSSVIDIKKSCTDNCCSCFKDDNNDRSGQNNCAHDDCKTQHVQGKTDYENVDDRRDCKCQTKDGKDFEKQTISAAKMYHWLKWAEQTSYQIEHLLFSFHRKKWRTEVFHIEHVKSYAPHIDHIVLDLYCTPV